jgi:thiosulfate/3-mercaptopyruvate sulfurtransferase
MSNPNLVSATQLNERIVDGSCVVVDCRFDLLDMEKGKAQYLEAHLPGAAYAHLDDDLSSPILEHTGRHPLPPTENFARFLASIGWTADRLLVAYDEASNAIASRLWWLMRFHGQAAALLDGGLAAWRTAGLPLESGHVSFEPSNRVDITADESMVIDTQRLADDPDAYTVIDARASERFTGEVETLDSKAGHIPGALNRPFGANLSMNGRFKKPEELRDDFQRLLADRGGLPVVHSCGSGVTACHNLFAMELAGLDPTILYAGSWSEWIRDPGRPIETG